MKAYACYRLPKAKTFVRVEGSPMEIQSYSHIGCQSGFVVAPFAIAPHTPLLIIKPESIETHAVGEGEEPAISNAAGTLSSPNHADRMRYASNFKTFHDKLADGTFRKIVLARTAEESVNAAPETLFLTACRLSPTLFVDLFAYFDPIRNNRQIIPVVSTIKISAILIELSMHEIQKRIFCVFLFCCLFGF